MGGRTVELRVRAHHSRQRSVEEAWMCRAKLSGHRPRACPSRARVVCGREGVACERHTVQGKGGVMRPGLAQKAVGDIRRDVPGGNVFAAIFGVDSEHARTESRGDGRAGGRVMGARVQGGGEHTCRWCHGSLESRWGGPSHAAARPAAGSPAAAAPPSAPRLRSVPATRAPFAAPSCLPAPAQCTAGVSGRGCPEGGRAGGRVAAAPPTAKPVRCTRARSKQVFSPGRAGETRSAPERSFQHCKACSAQSHAPGRAPSHCSEAFRKPVSSQHEDAKQS